MRNALIASIAVLLAGGCADDPGAEPDPAWITPSTAPTCGHGGGVDLEPVGTFAVQWTCIEGDDGVTGGKPCDPSLNPHLADDVIGVLPDGAGFRAEMDGLAIPLAWSGGSSVVRSDDLNDGGRMYSFALERCVEDGAERMVTQWWTGDVADGTRKRSTWYATPARL